MKKTGWLWPFRSDPVDSDCIALLKPAVNALVSTQVHLLADEHHSYANIAKVYNGLRRMNHGRGGYARGHVHSNTEESYGRY